MNLGGTWLRSVFDLGQHSTFHTGDECSLEAYERNEKPRLGVPEAWFFFSVSHVASFDASGHLEHEDRIDTERRLIVAFIQASDLVVVPIEADFGTNQHIGVWLDVHAQSHGVDV